MTVVATMLSQVERADDRRPIFYGCAGWILSIFGVARCEFRANQDVLSVKVFLRPPK